MDQSVLDDLTLDSIIDRIARGHAFNKHVKGEDTKPKMQGVNAFTSTHDNNGNYLGPDLHIETPLDLKHYIEKLIDDYHTVGFVRPRDGAVVLYSNTHNVAVHISPNDREDDYGTIYRYDNTAAVYKGQHKEALFTPLVESRHHYRVMENVYPGSVRAALEDHIVGIQTAPEKYTAKLTTQPEHARFLVALGNENRPGRKDVQGAGNNGMLHSVQYAETHQRNILGPPDINRPGVVVSLDDYRSADEDFELANQLKEHLDVGDDDGQGFAEPGMM